jgi:hypothetical protein
MAKLINERVLRVIGSIITIGVAVLCTVRLTNIRG